MPTVRIDGTQILDWNAFHTVFAATFGFPDFYGRNMNAWIDCMTDLSEGAAMTSVTGSTADPVNIHLSNADAIPREIFDALVEGAAFVNWRRMEVGEPAILLLAYHRSR